MDRETAVDLLKSCWTAEFEGEIYESEAYKIAIDYLVLSHFKLVQKLVGNNPKFLIYFGLSREDIYAQGCLYLLQATLKYNPYKANYTSWVYFKVSSNIREDYKEYKKRCIAMHRIDEYKSLGVKDNHNNLRDLLNIAESLSKVDPRIPEIIEMRYLRDYTFREIGSHYRMTRQGANLLHKIAIDKMREVLCS